MNKKVSIIIPAYNEEKYLLEALKSVQAQTMDHDHMEIIVVDNASTDETASVYYEFLRDNCVSSLLVEEPLLSPGRAKNRGAAQAQGELLIFLDADSRMEPCLAEEVYDWYKRGYLMGTIRIKVDSSDRIANLFFDFVHYGKKLVRVAANMGYCEKEFFFSVGGFDPELKHAEDLEFFTRAKQALRKTGKPWCVVEGSSISTSTRRMDRLPLKIGYPLTFLEWALGGFLGFQRNKYIAYR